MSGKKKPPGDIELRYRPEIIGGLRDHGHGYRDIAKKLGIPARQVEAVLGEVETLRNQGYSIAEVARLVGLPRTSAQDLLRRKRPPVLTAQKAAAVAALADMRGMQVDVLAWFLGTEVNHTHVLLKDLYDAKLIHELKQVQPGKKWAYLTRPAETRLLGWRPKEWEPPLMFAEHYRAVAQARIMLVGNDPTLWVPERRLWRRASIASAESGSRAVEFSTGRQPRAGRLHIHDGRFLGVVEGKHGWWALEVELSVKDRAYMDIALQGAIRAARDSTEENVIGLLYLCRTKPVMNGVHAASERLPTELSSLAMDLVIDDFDRHWKQFLRKRRALREAARDAKRERHTLHVFKDAS